MLAKLLLLFIIVPALELILLIEIGQVIGTLPTIALIIFTGFLGAFLTRRQGLQVLLNIKNQTKTGQVPTDSLFDGALILVAGAFLMTPGVLTDIFGFLCLIPTTRHLIKQLIWSRMQKAIQTGKINVMNYTPSPPPPYRHQEPEDVIIINPDDKPTA